MPICVFKISREHHLLLYKMSNLTISEFRVLARGRNIGGYKHVKETVAKPIHTNTPFVPTPTSRLAPRLAPRLSPKVPLRLSTRLS